MAVNLIKNKKHLTPDGLNEIVSIRASLNLGLTPLLNIAFPDITPVSRPLVENKRISDLYWIAGFTSGEGCFRVVVSKSRTSKLGWEVKLRFYITQHTRDKQLMESLVSYLKCGRFVIRNQRDLGDFTCTKFSDIYEKIIPFFNLYQIEGVKFKDFND